MKSLISFMQRDLAAGDIPAGTEVLVEKLESSFGPALLGVLMYGSCRRKQDASEGLVDLLVIVSDYRGAYGTGPMALANHILPPNVFYLQAEHEGKTLRSKYAVISLRQFSSRAGSRFDHYFWARFCQPTRMVSGKQGLLDSLAVSRARAAISFASRIAPLIERGVTAEAFWVRALSQTYRCELRPEPPDNARGLIANDPAYWNQLTALLATLDIGLKTADNGLYARANMGRLRQLGQRLAWSCRRPIGKLFNLARLFKAAGTFSNGIDYIVWKVERHSGVRIEPTERMRRYPRLAAWGLAWRMWREGGFR